MVIVVHVSNRFELHDEYAYFIRKLIEEWVQQHCGHQFFLFINKADISKNLPTGKNISICPYHVSHHFFGEWQVRRKLAALVKKQKADVLFSFEGSVLQSQKLRQCLILLHDETGRKWSGKKWDKVKSVVVLSGVNKENFIRKSVSPEKVSVVYGAPAEMNFQITDDDKLAIKEKYTEGNEFFVYKGLIAPERNIIQLLKAFSIFKKRQKSSMNLVLAGRKKWNTGDFDTLINTYKYKQDIVIADQADEQELIKISCSAYAFIYPPANRNSVLFGLDAMRYGVPVIANETSPLKEIAGTSALYFNASDVADIADKMMLVYKDETLRSRMIEDARAIAGSYTWQGAAATIWQSIETEAN